MRRTITAALAALTLGAGGAAAQDAPFGNDGDVADAESLWNAMVEAGYAGDDAIHAFPYSGTPPHGKMLETFYTDIASGGHRGTLLIKRNYGPEGVTAEEVISAPGEHLASVTVMFRREDGYDPENHNWFWSKFLPDGSLAKNAKGLQLAGRVAKGMDAGCIACHSQAPGGDYLYTTDSAALAGTE